MLSNKTIRRQHPNGRNYSYALISGRKYHKVMQCVDGETESVHAFIDKKTGEVYKAASYKSPAKGVRFDLRLIEQREWLLEKCRLGRFLSLCSLIMDYTKDQLIDALVAEWDYLCHDDYDPQDPTPEEYRKEMEELTIEQLIEETSTGEGYTLEEFMENWV